MERRHGQNQEERPRRQSRAAKEGRAKGLSSTELLLVRKDLGTIWARNSQRALLVLLPIALAVVLPAVYFAAISLLPVEEGARLPQALLALLPEYAAELDYRQSWLAAFTELL